MIKKVFMYFILAVVFLIGCSPVAAALETETRLPSKTATLTSTIEPTNTFTNTPVPSATAAITVTPVEYISPYQSTPITEDITLDQSAFGYLLHFPFNTETDFKYYMEPRIIYINSGYFMVGMQGVIHYPEQVYPEFLVEDYLERTFRKAGCFYYISERFELTLKNLTWTGINFTGDWWEDESVEGKAIITILSDEQYFFAMTMQFTDRVPSDFETNYEEYFYRIIEGVEFLPRELWDISPCAASTDSTYGLTIDNPVRIGGGEQNGEMREWFYLDALQGPNGEPVNFLKIDNEQSGVDLDVYRIYGLSEQITVYFDTSTYEELMAPAGFICKGDFQFAPIEQTEE